MNKKGFTLIELLAVIIILGILMIIAIPSVTRYINDSRKNAYIDTAKEIISGARNLVNDGKLEMFDTDTTYYIDQECIGTENASKSPYGDFTKAYVVVTYNGKGYDYFWTSVDDAGQGISKITPLDKLDIDKIESDLTDNDIPDSLGVDGRSKYMIIDKEQTNCGKGVATNVSGNIDGETGEKKSTAAQTISANPEVLYLAEAKRFIGANPNNYVSFNNGELWRIIGVYGDNLKIIKTNSIGSYNLQLLSSNWEGSNLEIYLNDTYYNSLASSYKEMIVDGTWNVGKASVAATSNEAYEDAKTKTLERKVGIIASYEYLYASITDCHATQGAVFHGYSCSGNDWIYSMTEEGMWTLTPNKDTSSFKLNIDSIGRINSCLTGEKYVYPVVYLNSSVKITGGSGTQSDPYTLGL